MNLNNKSSWTPITINVIIPISVDNGYGHADIKLYLKGSHSSSGIIAFDGRGNSTFYIKYLGP